MTRPLSATQEDYVETIFRLAEENRVARVKDIAAHLGVHKSTVTGALRSLSEMGLVNYEPYGYITLTAVGEQRARHPRRRTGTPHCQRDGAALPDCRVGRRGDAVGTTRSRRK